MRTEFQEIINNTIIETGCTITLKSLSDLESLKKRYAQQLSFYQYYWCRYGTDVRTISSTRCFLILNQI